MNTLQLHIILTCLLTATACCLPGVWLMLRGIALLSDAIAHAILPGIVILFLYCQCLESPLLILGAASAGLLTVLCTERIIQTRRLHKDAAIGLVFPLFFSVGVLLISLYARTVHLDIDMVLLGEVAFTPFNKLIINGYDCGPCAIWLMGGITLLNGIAFIAAYKELLLTTFDATLSCMLGFSSALVYYTLMVMTSITAVGALTIVGSTVVVALMLTPVATAYLLTSRVVPMTLLSLLFGAAAAISGYTCAHIFNVSIAGSVASMSGLLFFIVVMFAPKKGLLAHLLFEREQRRALAATIVRTFLQERGPTPVHTMAQQLGWSEDYLLSVLHNDPNCIPH